MSDRSQFLVLKLHLALFLGSIAFSFSSCDRMVAPRGSQLVKDADARAAAGDYGKAIELYEAALDGSAKSADVHYRLALLYDDKLNDPVNALHHFKRYIAIAPTGSHTADAKNFMKRDELALVTAMSGDSVVPRAEAARLRNENLALRKQLDDARAHTAAPAEPKTRRATRVSRATRAKATPTPGRRRTSRARAQ